MNTPPAQKSARPRVGAGIILIRDGSVLLVRRGKPPREGEWSLPGGAQEAGETLHEAALRELREETGLEAEIIGLVDAVDLMPGHDNESHYTLIDFLARCTGGALEPGSDAADARWFPLGDLGSLNLWEETRRVIRKAAALSGENNNRPPAMTVRGHLKAIGWGFVFAAIAYGFIHLLVRAINWLAG